MFPQSPCESDYEYLVPVMHIDTARSDDWRVDYDGYLKSVPSLPRAQTATGRGDDEDYEDPYDYRTTPMASRISSQLTQGAPPVPAREPTAKMSTQPRNRLVATGRTDVIPANSMAAVISQLTKFNVRDDSARDSPAARPPVVVVSPQPTVPPATLPRQVNKFPSSSQGARPGSMSPARIVGRPASHRPSDGPTQTPAQVRPTQTPAQVRPTQAPAQVRPTQAPAQVRPTQTPAQVRPTQAPAQVRPTQAPAQVRPTQSIPSTVGDPDTDIMVKDVRELSTEEVSVCLQRLKMSEHVADFADKEVDGEMLSCLDQTILVDEFHFSGFNAIKLMKFVNEGYVPRTRTLQRATHGSNS